MTRGMNVVILDAAGNYLMSKNFDTVDPTRGRAEGEKMAQFLDDLPSERMVCVSSLEATGNCSVLYVLKINLSFSNPSPMTPKIFLLVY